MRKMKTKTIANKRFKITKNGKVIHRTQGRRHLRNKKSASRKRRQDKPRQLTNTKQIRQIKRFLLKG